MDFHHLISLVKRYGVWMILTLTLMAFGVGSATLETLVDAAAFTLAAAVLSELICFVYTAHRFTRKAYEDRDSSLSSAIIFFAVAAIIGATAMSTYFLHTPAPDGSKVTLETIVPPMEAP
jgi:cation transport ATPase